MSLTDKVLTAFSLCQKGESGQCEDCPYFKQNVCKYQFLAEDTEKVIKELKRGLFSIANLYKDSANLTIDERNKVVEVWANVPDN